MQFDAALEVIFSIEGLLTSPSDPGGLTKFGISSKSHPTLTHEQIASLTKEQAASIYERDYWNSPRINEMPEIFRLPVFDACVLQGVKTAISLLQQVIGAKVDGIIGPETLGRLSQCDPYATLTAYMATRAFAIARLDAFETYGHGWMRRLFTIALLANEAI